MGAPFELAEILWPEAVNGRMPSLPTEIDWTNPLARGLTVAIHRGGWSSLLKAFNPAGSKYRSVSFTAVGAPSLIIGAPGVGVQFPGAANGGLYVNDVGTPAEWSTTTPVTTLVLATPGPSTANRRMVFGTSSIGIRACGLSLAASANTWQYECYGVSGQSLITDATTMGDNDLAVVVGVSRSTTSHELWVNGAKTGTSSANSGSNPSTASLFQGCSNDTNTYVKNHTGQIFLSLRWTGRALNAAEIAEITRNPWQVFSPPSMV